MRLKLRFLKLFAPVPDALQALSTKQMGFLCYDGTSSANPGN